MSTLLVAAFDGGGEHQKMSRSNNGCYDGNDDDIEAARIRTMEDQHQQRTSVTRASRRWSYSLFSSKPSTTASTTVPKIITDDEEQQRSSLDESVAVSTAVSDAVDRPPRVPVRTRDNNKNDTLLTLQFRSIQPDDRQQIEDLHIEWFPVSYQSEFFDELVHGRMAHSGEPLFTHLAVNNTINKNDNNKNNEIVACVVGSFVNAHVLSESTRHLLVNDTRRHPRLFYIMTVGSQVKGLGTYMIQQTMKVVEQDDGCGVIYLHVLVDNTRAIRMYEKLGFYRVQEIPNYYNIDGVGLRSSYLYAKYYHGNRGHLAFSKLFYNAWSMFYKSVMSRDTWSLLLSKLCSSFSYYVSNSSAATTATAVATINEDNNDNFRRDR